MWLCRDFDGSLLLSTDYPNYNYDTGENEFSGQCMIIDDGEFEGIAPHHPPIEVELVIKK